MTISSFRDAERAASGSESIIGAFHGEDNIRHPSTPAMIIDKIHKM
jgi:hypothetical protein